MKIRASVVAVALVLPSLALAQAAPPTPAGQEPTVVFVCEHGAAKSVIATAYFNKLAAERGLRARAIYRGVNPDAALSAAALKGLRDDGLPVPTESPSRIADADVDRASVIFAIGCTLPPRAAASGKADNWNDVPGDQGYAAMRDAVKKHVERLVEDLLVKQGKG
jgi:arsenate reductase